MRRRQPSSIAFVVAGLVGVLIGLAACATSSEGGSAGPRAADFAAAEVGNAWSYVITPGPEAPQTVRYTSRDDRGFYVDDRGGRLMPRSDGLYDGERFLLKEPVVAGAAWIAVQKGPRPDLPGVTEQYRIVATDVSVTVPAGTFTGCVEVEASSPTRDPETGRPATLLMRWVWAKHTGMVRLQQLVLRDGDKAPMATATMELASFTPAVAPTR